MIRNKFYINRIRYKNINLFEKYIIIFEEGIYKFLLYVNN